MPRSHMDHEMGEEWDEDNKSYSSYNIVYQPQDSRYSAAKSDLLEVKVGMGINLRPTASNRALTKLSYPLTHHLTNSRGQNNRFLKSHLSIVIKY
jgi:hypothetical protein